MTVGGPRLTLSNGVTLPAVGLGTWQSSPEEAKNAVKTAVRTGYRLIDTAATYANEEAIGEAVKELIAEGVVKREDLFITTKAWSHTLPPNKIEAAIRSSLKKLQLDYVDLYLAHCPAVFNEDMTIPINDVSVEDIWSGFDHIYKLGLARAVGVSNWSSDQIARVLKLGKTPVHMSQVELHLYFNQHDHHDFCKKHNILVTSYGTLGSPGRVNFDQTVVKFAPAPSELKDENVIELGKKHNKTPAQVLLRYALDRGLAIIPKSVHENRIKENFNIFDFQLTSDEIRLLESTKQNQRLFLFDFMHVHKEDSFKAERH